MEQTKIALLGLGLMGSGMAGRLLDAGYPLTLWNRTPGKSQALEARGARRAKSPREAAPGAAGGGSEGLGRAGRENGCELVDAPVTGSKPQAEAGQLLFLAGGSSATVDKVTPILKA